MSSVEWEAVAVAGGISLVSPLFIRPLLKKLGILDVPNKRSSHASPTLRGGGVAPLLGFLVVGIWSSANLPIEVALILGAAAVVSLVGLMEDLRGLRISARAALQILTGAALALMLPDGPVISWIWIPLAAVAFAANVNFTNFMDGVNGISSLHGLVSGLAFALLGAVQGAPWLVTVGLVIAVSFAAFLPWNLTPPGMFLGDVGSYLLGGALGATSLAALSAGLNPIGSLAPLSIYWVDTVMTLMRRVRTGKPIYQAHRSHVYQRLTNTGLTHIEVAGVVALFTGAASAIGLLAAATLIPQIHALVLGMVLAAGYLLLPRLRGDPYRLIRGRKTQPADMA